MRQSLLREIRSSEFETHKKKNPGKTIQGQEKEEAGRKTKAFGKEKQATGG